MNKLTSCVAVLLVSSVGVAGPAFTLPAMIATVNVSGGDSFVTANVGASGTGAVQGLNLYLEVAAPLEIIALQVDGSGTMFGANSAGAYVATHANGGSPLSQFAFGMVTTATGTVAPNSLPVAIATIKVPAGSPPGDYFLTTDLSWSLGVISDWAGEPAAAQATGIIRTPVPPEPGCALLLLAGLPLLRLRRR